MPMFLHARYAACYVCTVAGRCVLQEVSLQWCIYYRLFATPDIDWCIVILSHSQLHTAVVNKVVLSYLQVSLVINYDLPNNRELYIHRIGRSGRYGRKVSHACLCAVQMIMELHCQATNHVKFWVVLCWHCVLPAGCCYQLCQKWWHQDPQRHWAILQYTSRWDGKHTCIHDSMNCLLLFMMPSVTVLILTFASVCAANECGRLDIEAAQHVWGALAVYDTYSLLAAVGESQTVVSTPSADSCVTESHSLNHCRCVLCVPFHVLLQGLHCIWHVNAFHHYWYCFAWLLWYAQSQLVKLY